MDSYEKNWEEREIWELQKEQMDRLIYQLNIEENDSALDVDLLMSIHKMKNWRPKND